MTDKKKNAASGEMVAPKARGGEKEKEQSKDTRTVTREREIKSTRHESRDSKESGALARLLRSKPARFIRDAYHELRYKVTWPTFEEARNMTFVVLALSTAVGLLLAAADLGLFQLFRLISGSK